MERRRKRGIVIAAAGIALVLAAGGMYLWKAVPQAANPYRDDENAVRGRLPRVNERDIQEELDGAIDDAKLFNISILSAIVIDPASGTGEARIENVAENRYLMQVEIRLANTGERLYLSPFLKPGESLETIRLDAVPEAGIYDATAVFCALTQTEGKLFGQASAQIKLYVPDADGNYPTPAPEPSGEPTAANDAEFKE